MICKRITTVIEHAAHARTSKAKIKIEFAMRKQIVIALSTLR